MDISATTAPDSTQVNAEDFIGTSRTVTISAVREGTSEQPVNIDLLEFPGRSYRPGKSMRRVLLAAWGADSSAYVGRRMTLFNDPEISFGRDKVGGIRISALSDISRPMTLALTVSRGKRAPFVVQPLIEARPAAQPAPTNGITPEQMTTLMAAMKDAGLTVKDAALAYLSQTIGRDISASRDLTADEADLVIHELQNEPAGDES